MIPNKRVLKLSKKARKKELKKKIMMIFVVFVFYKRVSKISAYEEE